MTLPIKQVTYCIFGLLDLILHACSLMVMFPPGDTASLNCSYPNASSIIWYRRLTDQSPQPLLRAFDPSDYYVYTESGRRFIVKENHSLVIRNVSCEDTATYYCARLDKDVCSFGEGIDLRVNGSNEGKKDNINEKGGFASSAAKGSEFLLYIFIAVLLLSNILLLLWIAFEKKWLSYGNIKISQESQQVNNENDLHYAEVMTAKNRKSKISTMYAEVQMRKTP
ncbi:uncharacterized protein LOC120521310 [Polypterus senegalus]|uniref:uncharacterized protein LOC120521310 n=1 Tax=Polypterus senegalus TaxID=55291 RepID=UPI001965324C|nr:uncharacterized protein LOC120521310 [Polypterus senegalus]